MYKLRLDIKLFKLFVILSIISVEIYLILYHIYYIEFINRINIFGYQRARIINFSYLQIITLCDSNILTSNTNIFMNQTLNTTNSLLNAIAETNIIMHNHESYDFYFDMINYTDNLNKKKYNCGNIEMYLKDSLLLFDKTNEFVNYITYLTYTNTQRLIILIHVVNILILFFLFMLHESANKISTSLNI